MRRTSRRVLTSVLCLAAFGAMACEKGPAQKAGEKVDKVLDTDKAVGKGPVEKAGKEVDKAADSAKKK